jgi:hypothetical protein
LGQLLPRLRYGPDPEKGCSSDYCVVDDFFTMPWPGEMDPHADVETAAVAPKGVD